MTASSASLAVPFAGRRARLMAFLALGVSTLSRALVLPNHDTSWFTYIAAELLRGASFYDRFADPNWPLAAYVMMPAAWLWLAGVPIAAAISLETHAVAAASIALSCHIHAPATGQGGPRPGILAAILAVAFLILPAGDFSQREHLFVMLVLPYAALATLRLEGGRMAWPWAVAAGVAAGLGASIKPIFVALPLAIEAVVLLRSRSLKSLVRPEVATLICCMAATTTAVLFFFPQYLDMIPWVVDLYSFFRVPIALPMTAILSLIPALCAAFAWRAAGPHARSHLATGTAAVAAAIVLCVVQGKAWSYQALPAYTLTVILLGQAFVWRPLAGHASRLSAERQRGAGIFAISLVAAWQVAAPVKLPGSLAPYLAILGSRAGSFDALALTVPPAFPAGPCCARNGPAA